MPDYGKYIQFYSIVDKNTYSRTLLLSATYDDIGMAQQPISDRLVNMRRSFHQYPEPSWCEFYTTSRLVDEIENIGVDHLYVGEEVLDVDKRMGVPAEEEIDRWYTAAEDQGARTDVLDKTEGGMTGAVAVLEQGTGPTVGLRVDIDALRQKESAADSHHPANEGFRSENHGIMHACGHDAHMTIGLGILNEVKESDFAGTFKVFFQPAEEVLGGGRPMAATEHISDIDQFFALHIGLGHPTGEIVAGADAPLAVKQIAAEFEGESAHAGLEPQAGRNVMQAVATATQNLYSIPRHSEGLTRVNVGSANVGSAPNVVAEEGKIELEVRGGTNNLRKYMFDHAKRVLENAADMHECSVETDVLGQAPREDSDDDLVDAVTEIAQEISTVSSTVRRAHFGASEDVTYLMKTVKENGGNATFLIIGTDHPTGHHTSTFDVDEDSLEIGVRVLSQTIEEVSNSL